MFPRHWAVTDKSVGRLFIHLAHSRPRDFDGFVPRLFFDGIRAIVSRAALVGRDLGLVDQIEYIPGLKSDVLYPLVAGDLIGHAAQRRFELRIQASPLWRAQRYSKGSKNAC